MPLYTLCISQTLHESFSLYTDDALYAFCKFQPQVFSAFLSGPSILFVHPRRCGCRRYQILSRSFQPLENGLSDPSTHAEEPMPSEPPEMSSAMRCHQRHERVPCSVFGHRTHDRIVSSVHG
jgi:hypothetical protein